MNRVRGNFVDTVARDVPWPASEGGEDADNEEVNVGKPFYAHDISEMARVDREAESAAIGEVDEIGKLQAQMVSDYEGYVRSGGADRLMKLLKKHERAE